MLDVSASFHVLGLRGYYIDAIPLYDEKNSAYFASTATIETAELIFAFIQDTLRQQNRVSDKTLRLLLENRTNPPLSEI